MDKKVHLNFIISTYLIFMVAGLGLAKYFYHMDFFDRKFMGITIVNLIFYIGLGYLIKQGYNWIKYLFLVITISILFQSQFYFNNLNHKLNTIELIFIAQRILIIIITVLIFSFQRKMRITNFFLYVDGFIGMK